ncbi:hypothetical protein POM88_029063 [Heracleum sosnowskyi]|uniref:Uncharacterized protein n=1 Tax=Heracleum sosnowskyi TaxID=360622 RepID=A0AAD8MEJ2_9APIA|nr:hypothetical protein POM88_029063 [Heracleum sosnowskyi]
MNQWPGKEAGVNFRSTKRLKEADQDYCIVSLRLGCCLEFIIYIHDLMVSKMYTLMISDDTLTMLLQDFVVACTLVKSWYAVLYSECLGFSRFRASSIWARLWDGLLFRFVYFYTYFIREGWSRV